MAGATIILRDSENRALFSNSIAARLVGIGTSWNKIRAGILLQGDGNASISGPVGFAFGFCSGTTNVYGDATTTHFVGTIVSSGWTLTSDFWQNANFQPGKRVGVTQTLGTSLTAGADIHAVPGTAIVRSMMFLDITKGSPDYTFGLFFRLTPSVTSPPTEADFLTQMEMVTPTFTNHANATPRTLAVDEGVDGTLDAFNMYWAPEGQMIEVSMVGVTILS